MASVNFLVLVIGILSYVSSQVVADSHSAVKFLPGFKGPLPFHLQTGYIGVDESEDVQLFYYFVESERNPKQDPLILWMTGGPGCSSFTALAFEIGPLNFEKVKYNGTLPTLVLNPHAWTKIASIIFLDLPVGTGFSYGRTSIASGSTDSQASAQAVQFLRKWLVRHGEFLSNPFYVGGDSYAGVFVPIITQMISNGNEAGLEPSINLKGYVAGNPFTFPSQSNFSISFSHGMGLISDELYESLRRSCGLEDQKADPNSVECSHSLEAFKKLTDGLNQQQILENNCGEDSPQLRRSLSDRKKAVIVGLGDTSVDSLPAFKCRVNGRWLSAYWFNDESVQKALHIRKGTTGTWVRCNRDSLAFETLIWDVRPYHANLSTKGYRSLVYRHDVKFLIKHISGSLIVYENNVLEITSGTYLSGDHDFLIPFQSTQAWIRELNYSIIDDWRPWIVKGQYAGYTRAYSNNMTFATVKGGGHTAPEYRPEECYAMFERWTSHKPL